MVLKWAIRITLDETHPLNKIHVTLDQWCWLNHHLQWYHGKVLDFLKPW
jgi:hypothetical protein